MFRAGLVSIGLMALAVTGLSGAAQSEADWRQLVLGLVHDPWELAGVEDPSVRVGALPDGFRDDVYVPADATVHGSVLSASGAVTVVASVDRSAEQLWPEFRDAMMARGWRVPEQATGDTRSIADVALAWVFCGQGVEAALVTVTGARPATRLRIDRYPEYRIWHCAPGPEGESAPRPGDRAERRRRMRADDVFMLRPPPYSGDRALGACRTSFISESGYGDAIPSTLGREDLLAHYRSQLEQAGWTPRTDAASAALAEVWARDDLSAVLVLAPVSGHPGCWHVIFHQRGSSGGPELR